MLYKNKCLHHILMSLKTIISMIAGVYQLKLLFLYDCHTFFHCWIVLPVSLRTWLASPQVVNITSKASWPIPYSSACCWLTKLTFDQLGCVKLTPLWSLISLRHTWCCLTSQNSLFQPVIATIPIRKCMQGLHI